MPADFIIRTGDMIKFTVPPPLMIPTLMSPIPLVGTSKNLIVVKMPACLDGDELPPLLRSPQPYTFASFSIPGMIMVSVKLTPSNKTMQSKNGKAILIKGTPFIAEFKVTVPAQQPTPAGPIPDPSPSKPPGTAEFITTNTQVKAG
jgi:hypothetical protein